MGSFRTLVIMLLVSILMPLNSFSWVYPEHREIALIAIQDLDPERKAILEQLWTSARTGYEARLCEIPADTSLGIEPTSLDYAAWPAIAGDHSCSAADMVHNVLESDWILRVADIAARLRRNLAGVEERHERVNHLRGSDNELQRADPKYATRAGSNNVHFLLARHDVVVDGGEYIRSCLEKGAALNGLGAYSWYHIRAMYKASLLSSSGLSREERSQLALAALADEAFALHFLQDAFAAGHVAGTWGDASLRKGTHDYYNENGIEVNTWDREAMILMGDAYMRVEDAERAAQSVRRSLEHFLDAARGVEGAALLDLGYPSYNPDNLNVCKVNYMPDFRDMSERDLNAVRIGFNDVMKKTPIPGLASGKGENPRFRAELGPFIGVVPTVATNTINGGYSPGQETPGLIPSIEAAVRLGLGLEGVMNESGDGLVFLDIGYRQDGSSSTSFYESEALKQFGSLTATIPARSAITARLRLPFWLLPGDMLILGPIMFLISPETATNMAVQAGNGGLIPWQAGIATSFGRFQFVLGREVGVAFFGTGTEGDDRLFLPTQDDILIVGLKSFFVDFPIVEYRPFRTFSTTQSSSLAIQLTAGFDIPTHVRTLSSEFGVPIDQVPTPELQTIWHIGLHFAFDWRYYF